MSLSILSAAEIDQALTSLEGWSLRQDKLHRQFKFDSFVEAFGFMTQLALVSERIGHHPSWLNIYDRVVIDLTTDDVGGITHLDLELAQAANRLFRAL